MVGGDPDPRDPLSPLDPSRVPRLPGTARGWVAIFLVGTIVFATLVWFITFILSFLLVSFPVAL